MAQTSAPATSAPLSKRELRQQDRAECSKQVDRYHANQFLECMTNREAARKAAAKEKKAAAAEMDVKRKNAEQQWQAEQKARADWNQKRIELLAEQRAKRADCRKQAAQQKLRFVARTEFLEKCIAAK